MKRTHRQTMDRINGTDRIPETGRGQRCDRAAEWEPLLYDWAEGLTDEQTGAAVQRHLAECAYCRGALEDIRWMTSALRASVPEPKTDLSARVMDAVRAEEEAGGRIVTRSVDARTGRVLGGPSEKHGIRSLIRTVGSIAAALLLVLGLVYVVPMLRMGSGAASGTTDILSEMQSCEDSRFSGGVFIGNPTQTAAETSAGTAVGETALTENPYPVILRIPGLTDEQLREVLVDLKTADGTAATVTDTADGYLIAPLSAFETAQALLQTTYPELGIEIIRAKEIPQSYTGDAFYIQINDPQ